MSGGNRLDKIDELIKQKIGEIILKEVELPSDCFATVNKVETTKDLKATFVYVSVLPQDHAEQILTILNKRLPKIQHELSKIVEMRNTPKITLKMDDQEERASQIEKLLDEL